MDDLPIHLTLFLILSAVIVLIGTFYSEPNDAQALRSFPKKLFVFFVGCGILTGLILLAEHTVASVH